MDPMKRMIQQKLIANVIIATCAQHPKLIFQESLCSQERVIRFATPFWRDLLGEGAVMYEAENGTDSFVVRCVCTTGDNDPTMAKVRAALHAAGNVLQSWDITHEDPNDVFAAFDRLVDDTIPSFEKALEATLSTELTEGERQAVLTAKYERNPQARAACLAYHGYTCKVCGMSFEEVYGPEFKDIIEVHHIVPLHQIGENYVVDPIHDLIPVCPNCHAAIHSKNGGKLVSF